MSTAVVYLIVHSCGQQPGGALHMNIVLVDTNTVYGSWEWRFNIGIPVNSSTFVGTLTRNVLKIGRLDFVVDGNRMTGSSIFGGNRWAYELQKK